MKRNCFAKGLVVLGALLALSSAVYAAPALKVLSATPKGQNFGSSRKPVTITFNQPVAKLSEENEFSSANCPISISPKVAGSCRYSGTQTVLFEPSENWALATAYNVRLKAGFKSAVSGKALAQDYAFSFVTTRPVVRSVRPTNGEHWLNLNPTIYVDFNLPVNAEKASEYIELAYSSQPAKTLAERMGLSKTNRPAVRKTVPLVVRAISDLEYKKDFSYYSKDQILAISALEPLQKGKEYTLTFLQGLPSTTGTLGMEKPFASTFFTYPELEIMGEENTGCLPYMPAVKFTTPVRLRELAAATKVSPAGRMSSLSEQELDALGTEYVNAETGEAYFTTGLHFLELTPAKDVTVTIGKNLRDIYGNRLGKDYTFTVSNDGYCPAVDFTGGFGVLESYLQPRLPIEVMNTPSVSVRGARFNKENFIAFDKEGSRWCAEKPLTDPTFDGEYTFKDVKNRTLRTFIDLKKFNPTAKDSIIFSQVKLNGKNYGERGCWISSTDNITDVGVTFKTSPESILLWTTSLETGEPLANMAVELRSNDNKILWTGSSDMNGLVRAPGWGKLDVEQPRWGQPTVYAFVSSAGGDAVVSNLWNDGLEPWRFGINFEYTPSKDTLRSALFTDRGVYRPGEKMYLKGVVRQMTDGAWHLPKVSRGTVVISDGRGEEVFKKDVTLSADMGTFDLSYDMDKNAYTGSWEVRFTPKVKGEEVSSTYASFRVEAVKQADFKVTLAPQKEDYFAGDEATFHASAQYNFGSPLADAKAEWTLRRSSSWFEPKGFDGYNFTPYFLRQNEYQNDGKLLLNSSGKLNGKGALSFTARMPQESFPVSVYAELGVQSPARQDLFARTSVLVHPASYYIGAKLQSDELVSGKPVGVDVVAVTPQGKKVPASVTVNIRKEQWLTVRKTGLSGRLEWVSDKKVTELPSQTVSVTEKGSSFSFTPEEAGNYFITLTSTDEAGRQVKGGLNAMVYGEGQSFWKKTDDDLLVLKQDKNAYKPGKTARISVESPYESAYALVTVERDGILDAWVTSVKGGADYIDVPIKPHYLPNVYVSVTLVRGRSADPVNNEGVDLGKPQGKMGYVNLNIEPDGKKITPVLKLNKKDYRPGDEVVLKLTAKPTAKNTPAEVAVMVVDEGVLALTAYKTPELFDVFYGSRALSVATMDNRVYVVGQRNFGEKGENRGGGGAALASKMGGADLRTNFAFTPYFNALVKTDKKGRAEVKFKLPDNLTSFRVMAVAMTADEFGSAQTNLKVSKPLMVTSNLPRFARKGDKFSCGAVVYNYEDKKGEITVSAQAQGALQLTGPAEKVVTIPLGKAQEVTYACEAVQDGPAQVAFSVKGTKETDGVLAKLTVAPVEKEQTLALYASTKTQQEELLDKPGNLRTEAKNRVTVSLASTALLNLKGSMIYLMTYPYDCLEQKMSKIVPVLAGAQLVEDFHLANLADLKKQAQEILNEVPEYQYASGGFGYWKNSLPDPYVTAYALEVNYLAKQAGYNVQTKSLEKAAKWLESAFNASNKMQKAYTYSLSENDTARAYAAYVLALYGKNVQSSFNTLYGKVGTLPLPAKAYLLKAAQASNRSQAMKDKIGQSILNHIAYTPQAAYFDAPEEMIWLHMGNVKASALALDSLMYAKVDFQDAFKTATWLLTQMNAQGHWNSTSVNASVFRALNTYYKVAEKVEPNFSASAKVGAKELLSAAFKGRSVENKTAAVPFADVYANGSEARVKIAKTGDGTLYYTLGQVYEPRSYDKAVDAGFSVTRQLRTLDDQPVHQVVAGERYKVTLTVKNATSRNFVVLEDFIPAGFEIIHTNMATESEMQTVELNTDWTGFTRDEKYDDRIAAFADYLPAGTHEYSYLVSASVAGVFAQPATWVSQMYEPAVFGRNTTGTLVIR